MKRRLALSASLLSVALALALAAGGALLFIDGNEPATPVADPHAAATAPAAPPVEEPPVRVAQERPAPEPAPVVETTTLSGDPATQPQPAPQPAPVPPTQALPSATLSNPWATAPWATPWARGAPESGPVVAYAPNLPAAAENPALDVPLPPARPAGIGVRATPGAVAPTDAPPPAAAGDFKKGSAAFVRIFKKEGQLELWLKKDGRFALFKTYPICKWSGGLGPKLKQADYQSPEGFYAVTAKQLKPDSAYHRAFNLGYPNAFDRQLGRTGGLIMVHGDCKSVGCFAMTNRGVEEIYNYVEAALRGGQREMPVHVFPFRMTETAIARETPSGFASLFGGAQNNWGDFWRNLKEGHDLFERTGEPPVAYACNGKYAFGAAGQSCTRIAGW